MVRCVFLCVLLVSVGCSESKPESRSSATPDVMPAARRTVTAYDAKGHPHQVTVTEGSPFPAASPMIGERAPLPKEKGN